MTWERDIVVVERKVARESPRGEGIPGGDGDM